jgi:phosphatidylserine/phosphatidylglycerophosphate/cardiolipin synthase-like enzyme
MKRGCRLLASTIAGLWLVTAAVAGPIETYYAPEDLPVERLATLYTEAKRSLYVAVYRLTAPPIVKALLDAKKRGVDVRVLTDREGLDDPKVQSALTTLHLAGIPIRVNRHDALMHLKQSVLDEAVNTSGSMNYTGSANRYNDERLDVLRDPVTTARAREKFMSLWNNHARFAEWTP